MKKNWEEQFEEFGIAANITLDEAKWFLKRRGYTQENKTSIDDITIATYRHIKNDNYFIIVYWSVNEGEIEWIRYVEV